MAIDMRTRIEKAEGDASYHLEHFLEWLRVLQNFAEVLPSSAPMANAFEEGLDEEDVATFLNKVDWAFKGIKQLELLLEKAQVQLQRWQTLNKTEKGRVRGPEAREEVLMRKEDRGQYGHEVTRRRLPRR